MLLTEMALSIDMDGSSMFGTYARKLAKTADCVVEPGPAIKETELPAIAVPPMATVNRTAEKSIALDLFMSFTPLRNDFGN